MSDNAESSRLVNSPAEIAPSDFLWGADEIGRAIGRNGRQAFHLLNRGEIKSAKKVGGRWVVSRAALLRELGRVIRHVHDRVARRRAVRRVWLHDIVAKIEPTRGSFRARRCGARGFSSSKNARNASRPGPNQGGKK
jgi:hypothetical protein